MRKKNFTVALAFSFFCCSGLAAQSPNQTFLDHDALWEEADSLNDKRLDFRAKAVSYFKNNEYFGPKAAGYTSIGFFLAPTLEYHFGPHTKAKLGYFLLKNSGQNKFEQSVPLFSIRHRIVPKLEVVVGCIDGTLNHNLPEPMFRFDRYYQNHFEYGFQFLWKGEKTKHDLWLNWEKFIKTGDPFQEQFTAGNSFKTDLYKSKNLTVSLPASVIFMHRGGQIDASPNPVVTTYNAFAGFETALKSSISTFTVEASAFKYGGDAPLTGANSLPYRNGYGFYATAAWQRKAARASLGYWYGNRFIGARGETLFQSVSDYDDTFATPVNRLLVMKYSARKNWQNRVKLEFMTCFYYDLELSSLNYSYSLFVVLDELFLIKRF